MREEERLQRVKSLVFAELGFVEAELPNYPEKSYQKGSLEGRQQFCHDLLRSIDDELKRGINE